MLEEGGEPAAAEPPAGDRAKPAGAALDVGWALQGLAEERLRDNRGCRVGGGGAQRRPRPAGSWQEDGPRRG